MHKSKTYTIYGINNAKAVMQSSKCVIIKIFLDYDGPAYKDALIKQLILDGSENYIINNISSLADDQLRNGKRSQGILIVFLFKNIWYIIL